MHKTGTEVSGCPQRGKTESEWYVGAQTCLWMVEDNVVEVPFDRAHLLEAIFSPENLNKAYRSVIRNKGCGGIDRMSCDDLLPWLLANKKSLICSLLDGSYRPNPVLRVEIPKDNGKMRQLGIPTVVDRLVQQAINQVLTPSTNLSLAGTVSVSVPDVVAMLPFTGRKTSSTQATSML